MLPMANRTTLRNRICTRQYHELQMRTDSTLIVHAYFILSHSPMKYAFNPQFNAIIRDAGCLPIAPQLVIASRFSFNLARMFLRN